jgi:hypothetical protein
VPKLTSVPRLEIYEVKILSFNGNNQYETQWLRSFLTLITFFYLH